MLDTFLSLPTLTSNEYEIEKSPERLGWLEPVPEEEYHNREALWQRLERDGYLFLKGILNRQQILAFREYYFQTLAPSGLLKPGTAPGDGIINPAGKIDELRLKKLLFQEIVPGKPYEDLCTSPEVVNFYEWFLGGKAFLHKRKIIRAIRPGSQVTAAHFDLAYLREGTQKVYTSWIPLGDCPLEQGGLIYLERSHLHFGKLEKESSRAINYWVKKNVTEVAEMLDLRWLIANYEAGDMVIHSPYMVHGSLNNIHSDGVIRLSTDIRYQLADDLVDMRWQKHWHPEDGL